MREVTRAIIVTSWDAFWVWFQDGGTIPKHLAPAWIDWNDPASRASAPNFRWIGNAPDSTGEERRFEEVREPKTVEVENTQKHRKKQWFLRSRFAKKKKKASV